MILKKKYFKKNGLFIAKDLIGALICRKKNNKIFKNLIVETELYSGENDSASHIYKRKTEKNKIMYEEGGVFYVYLCYGIHYMLNIVTGKKGYPEAVLIRGIKNFVGPGKLTKELEITDFFNGLNIDFNKFLWIEKNKTFSKIIKLPRIGIDYALKKDRELLWRFKMK